MPVSTSSLPLAAVNLHSKGRALLMLLLFSRADEQDAPTRIRISPHRNIPPLLQPYGDRGVSMFRIAAEMTLCPRTARSCSPRAFRGTYTSATHS
jgi:hypothetical protein